MKIKYKDIAKSLDISTATVSLAINNRPGVNPKTRQEILEYIENMEKKEAETEKTYKSVSMILHIINKSRRGEDADLFAKSYQEVYKILNQEGYLLNLVYWDERKEALKDVISRCYKEQASGIFLNAFEMRAENFREVRDCEIPMIIFDNSFTCENADSILLDNEEAVHICLDYLYEKGHTNILYMANTADILNFKERYKACKNYVVPAEACGKKPEILEIGSELAEIYANTQLYIEKTPELPTAIVCENYTVSMGVIKAIQEKGFKIGEDISILGIDELPESALLNFSYTCVQVLHKRKAHVAIHRLLYRIENNPEENIVIHVRNRFHEGESVKDLTKVIN